MDIAIVGLPGSGKTTLFNATTRGSAEVAPYGGPRKPNVGVAKVPDRRLDVLQGILGSRRVVPAEVTLHDLPASPDGTGRSQSISGEVLNSLQGADALLLVVRAFEDPSVPAAGDGVDPSRDLKAMLDELALADMEILERRQTRLAESAKGARAPEREAIAREAALMARLKDGLETGTPVRGQSLSGEGGRLLEGFGLLTAKPLMVVVNAGEDQRSEADSLVERVQPLPDGEGVRSLALCGKLEMELTQMAPEDEIEFRASMDAGPSGLDRLATLSWDVLDLVTFFTGNANEVRAWPVPVGTPAIKAAGKVHSDMERGFIRAEVVTFDDLERCGSLAEARRQGVLRQEGKGYLVNEGDVINILFSV